MNETELNTETTGNRQRWWLAEDWLAIWLGMGILGIFSLAVLLWGGREATFVNPFISWIAKPLSWTTNPLGSFSWLAVGITVLGCWGIFVVPAYLRKVSLGSFTIAFAVIALLTTLSLALSTQSSIKSYGLEYALWAILIGLVISNTVGTPAWLKPAIHTELYIKTGLVLLGAKVLFSSLMKLGPAGLAVAWVVTPVVLIATYWFGQRILKMESRTLNMVISADMSVCGVSAAIASAAACRAKKEELSLAIGISMAFTVVMMIVMPQFVKMVGMDPVVAGAWVGGTIDSTGAVVAAGKMIGEEAEQAATTVKMIQNILIGVVGFGVALYWVRFVEQGNDQIKPDAWEIWRRFPKFVLGFMAASIIFSVITNYEPYGSKFVSAVVKEGTDPIRDWFFAFAFVCIGIESNFRSFAQHLKGGKPIVLYACGQALNLCLTLTMAWLMFGKRD